MLEATLRAHGIGADRVEVIVDEQQAIDAALRMAQPGDLVLIFADALARGWKQITQFKPSVDRATLVSPKKQVPQTIAPDTIELADDFVPAAAPAPDVPVRQITDTYAVPGSLRDKLPVSTNRDTEEPATIIRDDRGVYLAREAND